MKPLAALVNLALVGVVATAAIGPLSTAEAALDPLGAGGRPGPGNPPPPPPPPTAFEASLDRDLGNARVSDWDREVNEVRGARSNGREVFLRRSREREDAAYRTRPRDWADIPIVMSPSPAAALEVAVAAVGPESREYPLCSRTVTDRCVQTRARGSRRRR